MSKIGILEWLKDKKFQTETGEQGDTLYYMVDLPQIISEYNKFSSDNNFVPCKCCVSSPKFDRRDNEFFCTKCGGILPNKSRKQ